MDPRYEPLARRIYETSYIRGNFTLHSGLRSSEYFDKYLFESDPMLLQAVTVAMGKRVVVHTCDMLAALEMGGIPVGTMLSYWSGKPVVFARKQAKVHGTAKRTEGPSVEGKHLLVIEDVVTSGGAVVQAIDHLRDEGATIKHAMCVIDREQGGQENLAAEGVTLFPLFTMSELQEVGS